MAAKAPWGPDRPGHVTILIIPHSREPQPQPSHGLRMLVQRYIEKHAPADLVNAGRVHVIGPRYMGVDVSAVLVPVSADQAGEVENRVREAIQRFLHPLLGGPNGRGWELGRDVYLSDLAAVIERVPAVDHVKELTLLRNGVPQGERFRIADDEMVVAGKIHLQLQSEPMSR